MVLTTELPRDLNVDIETYKKNIQIDMQSYWTVRDPNVDTKTHMESTQSYWTNTPGWLAYWKETDRASQNTRMHSVPDADQPPVQIVPSIPVGPNVALFGTMTTTQSPETASKPLRRLLPANSASDTQCPDTNSCLPTPSNTLDIRQLLDQVSTSNLPEIRGNDDSMNYPVQTDIASYASHMFECSLFNQTPNPSLPLDLQKVVSLAGPSYRASREDIDPTDTEALCTIDNAFFRLCTKRVAEGMMQVGPWM